jgi:hypothetical protein
MRGEWRRFAGESRTAAPAALKARRASGVVGGPCADLFFRGSSRPAPLFPNHFAPDGDLYVVEREGRALRVRPETGGVFVIGQLEVSALPASDPESHSAREDGLLGIALDPDFASNQTLYLYYSHPQEMLNRLSRFRLKNGRLDLHPSASFSTCRRSVTVAPLTKAAALSSGPTACST